jgi:exodeoxyribonuclease V
MLDARQLEDLQELFSTLILFGDPAQLAPVGQSGSMVFDKLPAPAQLRLSRIHRQAQDNPILDLAHALADPDMDFEAFEDKLQDAAARDDRVHLAERVNSDLMARSPVLVWRNATRLRLINAFRNAHGAPETALMAGEPLICDGLELPLKHRKKRIDLEARGLIKGAQVVYLGPGRKPGFSRLHIFGAEEPQISVASIIKIEKDLEEEPFIPFAATMGAAFVHGAAVTIHKAQGSQWPDVQVFAPDLFAAARAGRSEAGIPLWKRWPMWPSPAPNTACTGSSATALPSRRRRYPQMISAPPQPPWHWPQRADGQRLAMTPTCCNTRGAKPQWPQRCHPLTGDFDALRFRPVPLPARQNL